MRAPAALLAPLLLLACSGDQGVSAFVDPASTWRLTEMNGTTFAARASIAFPAPGRVTGQGPCNAYGAQQTAPYPWIEIGNITATKAACPDLAAEQDFFAALAGVSIAEVSGDTLILSADDGLEMLFKRQ